MTIDILDLENFYSSRLGQLAATHLKNAITRIDTAAGDNLDNIDFGVGFVSSLVLGAKPILMPAQQGTVRGVGQNILVDEHLLPFADNQIGSLLAMHYLEHSRDADHALRELWRVLVPEGRLTLIVPNRRGLWSRRDRTPFGVGHPYSRRQLRRLCQETGFVAVSWTSALHFLPFWHLGIESVSPFFEKSGRSILPEMAGALVVVLVKRVPAPITYKRRALRYAPAMSQPASV